MAKKSAGVFLLREERGEIVVLALAGRNSWDLPKGGLRDGESAFQAAKRELAEETGITSSVFLGVAPFTVSYALKSKAQKTVTFFLAMTESDKVSISKEHESYRWIPFADACDFLPERFHPVVTWAANHISEDEW